MLKFKSNPMIESKRIFNLIHKSKSILRNYLFSKVTHSNVFHFLLDIDSKKWPIIYLAKLRACSTHFPDFTDVKKDLDMKDEKKECLIELIDVLDENEAIDTLMNEKVLQEAFSTIGLNLFRTFANKSKTLSYSEILENKKTSTLE